MAHSIIHLYVHFNISVICFEVITQVILHPIATFQYMCNAYTLPCIDNLLSTFNLGYRPPIEMEIVSEVSSHPQLDLSIISS